MDNPTLAGLIIKGKVQRAGFRSKIKDVAKAHKLVGFTKNLQNYDEDVLVVYEPSNGKTGGFLRDLRELKSEQDSFIKERNKLEAGLSRLNEELDSELTSRSEESPGKVLMLLDRKKSMLRKLKFYESRMPTHLITNIVPVKDINEYGEDIEEAEYGNNFLIVRNEDEASDRLDEGIEALVDLRHSTSNLNYDIIDTDFAMLNVKYGALTGAVNSGFKEFPKEFAKAFDVVLDKKYGIRPSQGKK